jgi:hypothetical protein
VNTPREGQNASVDEVKFWLYETKHVFYGHCKVLNLSEMWIGPMRGNGQLPWVREPRVYRAAVHKEGVSYLSGNYCAVGSIVKVR